MGTLLAVAPASAAWTPYVNVVKQQDVEHPQVEMDPAGDAVFAWRHQSAIYTRVRTAQGTLSPIQRISSAFGDFDLAVDPQGNAYYVWTDQDSSGEHLRTRVRFADGTLSPIQTLKTVAPRDFVSGTVGVDASGTAVYAWDQQRYGESDLLQARTRSPSGTLSGVYGIGQGYVASWGRDADMAVDANGNATFVWDNSGLVEPSQIFVLTRVLDANGNLGPVTKVSPAGHRGRDGQAVVTPSGRALFGWYEYHQGSDTDSLLVRARSADGNFQPPQVVTTSDDLQTASLLQLSMAPTGQAALAWATNHAWYTRTRAPGGALGATRAVAKAFVRGGDLGIDSQGNVVFAWTLWSTNGEKTPVFARTESAGGAFSPSRRLSLAGYNAYFPVVAVSPAGDAAVGWQEGQDGFAIQASFGP